MEPKVIPITSKMSGEYATSAEASGRQATEQANQRASKEESKHGNHQIIESSHRRNVGFG